MTTDSRIGYGRSFVQGTTRVLLIGLESFGIQLRRTGENCPADQWRKEGLHQLQIHFIT